MSEGKPPRTAAEIRAERLKAALRDNLRRRKAQVRGRAEAPSGPDVDGPALDEKG